MNKTFKKLTLPAVIGALYAALTLVFTMLLPANLGYNVALGIEFRPSEALTVLPFLYPPAAWGLFVGCAIANMISPLGIIDIVVGSLASLIAGVLTAHMRIKWLAPLPPVIVNAAAIGLLLSVAVPEADKVAFPIAAAGVAIGQLAVCYGLGIPLLLTLQRIKIFPPIEKRPPKKINKPQKS